MYLKLSLLPAPTALALTALLAGCQPEATTTSSGLAVESAAPVASSATSPTSGSLAKPSNTPPIRRSEGIPGGVKSEGGLTVPPGFKVQLLADNVAPRRLAVAPGARSGAYDLFVAESSANRITVLRVENSKVVRRSTFTTAVDQPYGLAFTQDALFVGNTANVVRFAYKPGAMTATGGPQEITKLTEGGYNQHWTRNVLLSRDGKKLFVTVGSSCNTCEEADEQRAAISVMDLDGGNRRLYATGLRNPVGMAWYPGKEELWTAVNERDNLGDDVPPDYVTAVKDGAFYGWPYAYVNLDRSITPDPTFGAGNETWVNNTVAATVPLQAHSACLGIAFYPREGNFPTEYHGDAFLTYRGSWNRSAKTGYKVVRVDFKNGQPVSVSDFLTGFLTKGEAWGRPVDIQPAPDGSLLFSDDGGGKIWRISKAG